MKINIGEIEVNYELTEYEKSILTSEEQEYYKFVKETEQRFIETLKPTYNQMDAKDLDIEK